MKKCEECKAELLPGALFCNECGTPVTPSGTNTETSPRLSMPGKSGHLAEETQLTNPVFTPAVHTSHMGRGQTPFVSDERDSSDQPGLLGQDLEGDVTAQNITFVIPGSGRRVTLELKEEIQVGRSDPANQFWPGLDLTVDEGAHKGVSRRHAAIQHSNRGIVLVDLNSTNGTTLNGYRLPPDLPYPLHNGDEVSFGRLLVHVFLD